MPDAWARRAKKVALALAAILLFVLALELVKAGARDLGPFVRDTLRVTSPASALGFGWILAAAVLSGSPVAAISLAFFAAGVVDDLQSLLMITGSRLGASLAVLALAAFYHFRGRKEGTSLEVGFLAVLVTYTVYLPAAGVGVLLLRWEPFGRLRIDTPPVVEGVVDLLFGKVLSVASALLPAGALAAAGVVLLIGSIQLFDRALPDIGRLSRRARDIAERVYRPSIMIALGALVTTFTLSVSVSLGVLVPLAAKGYVRRENLLPYILGANITTFLDTLFASLLVSDPRAFTIVLAEILSVSFVTLAVVAVNYPRYENALLRILDRLLVSRLALTVFLLVTTLPPFLLLLVR